ncbi:MAG: SDR family NAD(P)-dependent oxidoreductase, partial [Betaproteobacteria bacterium]|nr:SDR family NAD(P)-dependent oxidoreductase [Betaproteobacteria bacterium]
MRVLVTGAAGFIGMHCAQRLVERGDTVVGVDNLSDYYSVDLKKARLQRLAPARNFRFVELDIAAPTAVERVFQEIRPDAVLHLAAQPGVRYSL